MKNPSFITKLALAAICAASLAPATRASVDPTGYVTLTATDGAGQSSWNTRDRWSDGAVPTQGKKYLVNSKINLRTPATLFSTPFAGDSLTLDNGAYLIVKSNSGSTISANYVLYQGTIRAVDPDRTFTFGGTMAIFGTQSNPSAIEMAANRETATVSAPLSGNATAFLSVVAGGSGNAVSFTADNSGYAGRLSFSCPNSSGATGRLRFSGATSAGISGDPAADTPFLTIESKTGIPVVELENARMDSTFTIENNNANARIELTGTSVLFGAALTGSAANIPVKVNCDALLQSASPLALDFTGGGRILARRNADGTIDSSSIAEGSTLTLPDGKIPVAFDGIIPHTNANFSATLLTIPTSVRTVTADDIDLVADDFGLMTLDVTTANGIQTVTLRAGNVVYYSVQNTASGWGNWAAYNQAAQYWSDNRAVHNDADYLINYDTVNCNFLRGCQQTFAGRSLTFARGGQLTLKGRLTAPDNIGSLRMFPGSSITTGDNGADYNALSGGLLIAGKSGDDSVDFPNSSGGTLNLLSNLSGSGPVRFVSNIAGTMFPVVLAGNNSAFTGTMEFYGANAGRALRVSIGDEANLGGNPAAINAAQTLFNTRVELVVTNNVSLDDSNRGITFAKPVATTEIRNPIDVINVGEGATLTFGVSVTLNANLEKTGAGTLGIGGTISGAASNLTVSAGSIMPVTRQASSALRYTMAAGTGLALALNPEDSDVAADRLYVEDASHLTLSGESLPATIRGEIPTDGVSVKCGILNVPASMASDIATALGANATFTDTATGRSRTFPVERETLSSDRVRFFASVRQGPTVLYIR